MNPFTLLLSEGLFAYNDTAILLTVMDFQVDRNGLFTLTLNSIIEIKLYRNILWEMAF